MNLTTERRLFNTQQPDRHPLDANGQGAAKDSWLTIYDLPSEVVGEPGLPDEYLFSHDHETINFS